MQATLIKVDAAYLIGEQDKPRRDADEAHTKPKAQPKPNASAKPVTPTPTEERHETSPQMLFYTNAKGETLKIPDTPGSLQAFERMVEKMREPTAQVPAVNL